MNVGFLSRPELGDGPATLNGKTKACAKVVVVVATAAAVVVVIEIVVEFILLLLLAVVEVIATVDCLSLLCITSF